MSLKIYFAGSISGGRQDEEIYKEIDKKLKKYGTVLSPFVADPSLSLDQTGEKKPPKEIHDEDLRLLSESNVVVAEVTVTSHGVGYEIGNAVHMDQIELILCLFRPSDDKKRPSPMLKGAENGTRFVVIEYKEVDEIDGVLENFLAPLVKRLLK